MKMHETRELSDAELKKRVVDDKESLAHLQFQQATKQIENTSQIRHIRRDIARILTVIRERELTAAPITPSAATEKVKQ